MVRLALEELVHIYPSSGVRAVDGVTLAIEPGERVALIGQNGSGKTTLVRHLNGLLRPTLGRVLVDGIDVEDWSVARLARVVGLVFQDPDRQIFAGSVRAEVEFGPRNLGFTRRKREAGVAQALEAVGLVGEAKTNPYDLGASRRKLLTLASVLAMQTPVLVLDEPTTGQDARGVEKVREVVRNSAAAGISVVAVSHDMRFVAENFERVIVMRDGSVVLDSPPVAAFSRDAWPELASTHVDPPLAARVGERLGLGSTPTDESLLRARARRAPSRAATD